MTGGPDASRPHIPDRRGVGPTSGSSTTATMARSTAGAHGSSSLPEAALSYAQRGWHVFPLQPGAKEPLYVEGELENGHLQASCDPAVVSGWWARWPSANIGLALEASGLCVIDVDPRYGANVGQLERVCDIGSPLVQHTSGGGVHLIYRDRGVDLRTGLSHIGLDGFDVKRRGYIVLAPSLHPSGERYAWDDDDALGDEIEIMPTPVLDSLRAPTRERLAAMRHEGPLDRREQKYVDNAVNGECQKLASAAEGTRHNTQYSVACRLGELVGAGVLERQRAEQRWTLAATQLYGCAPNRSDLRDLADGIERGMANPSGIPDEYTDARNLLAHLADCDDPITVAELYHENNPELFRHIPNPAVEELARSAISNVIERNGRAAGDRFTQLVRSA